MRRKTNTGKVLLAHAGLALLCLIISFNAAFLQNMPFLQTIVQIFLTAIILVLYWGYFYLDFYNKAKVDKPNGEYDEMYPLRSNTLYLLVTMGFYVVQQFMPTHPVSLVFNLWMSPYVFVYSWFGQNIFVKLATIFVLPLFCWLGYRTVKTGDNLFQRLSDKLLILVYKKK